MIRFAGPEDAGAVRALWERCFPDEGGFNPYFSPIFSISGKRCSRLREARCARWCKCCRTVWTAGAMCPKRPIFTGHAPIRTIAGRDIWRGFWSIPLRLTARRDELPPRLSLRRSGCSAFTGRLAMSRFFRIARHEIVKKTRGSVPQRLSEQDIPQLAALYDRLAAPCRIARSPSCWAGQIALFDALGKGVYGWREAGKLAAYAFCWEDTAQKHSA